MDTQEEIHGTIERIIYKNEENGFTVFVLNTKGNKPTTVKGMLPSINPGEQIRLTGKWIVHPKFGRQFEALECTSQLPTTIVGLKKYLSSGLIKGIGPVYAEKLVAAFGEHVLEVIDKTPQRLGQVPGIGPKKREAIMHAWKDQKEIASIMVFLRDKNIGTACATKIYKRYGKESLAILQQNPYRLAHDIWGIGFTTADAIAQQLGIEPTSKKRIKAAYVHVITQELSNGHLYIQLKELKEKTVALLTIDTEEVQSILTTALHELYEDKKIKLLSHEDVHYITLPHCYYAEKGCEHKIKTVMSTPSKISINSDQVYQTLRTDTSSLQLNEEQQKGIITALLQKVSIITGGPGTGKTTLIKKLLDIADSYKLRYKLAAPTGRAAKRITESTGRIGITLHRLLEFDVSSFSFIKNESNALDLDLLIIDESSMIDIFLAYALLKALPHNAHILFIGDVNQLPSVGAGNFLKDLISSKQVPCIELTKIFRQAQDSLIVSNAHRINEGKMPISYSEGTKRDYIFIKEDNPQAVAGHLENLYQNKLPIRFNAAKSMVLVPMNRGIVGTHTLNHQLQHMLNPLKTDKQLLHRGYTFKINDRVMQLRNNYEKLVFNGDTGTIHDINKEDQIVSVQFVDRIIDYEKSELDELTLAYAITVHKSQGSEYATVIVPLFTQHFALLQRNLVYTAITRAKQLCIFIGQPKAIAMAIKNTKGSVRTTFLKEFLVSDLSAR